MYLEVSAMTLLELHRTLESDRRREMHQALQRGDRISRRSPRWPRLRSGRPA